MPGCAGSRSHFSALCGVMRFGEFLPCSHILGVNKGNVRAGSAFCRERSGLRVPGRNQTRHVEHRGGSDFDAAEVVDQQASHSAWALRGGEGRAHRQSPPLPCMKAGCLSWFTWFLTSLISFMKVFALMKELFCLTGKIVTGSQLIWALTFSSENMGGKLVNYCF